MLSLFRLHCRLLEARCCHRKSHCLPEFSSWVDQVILVFISLKIFEATGMMEAEGQRTLSNPSTTLTSLLNKREKLQDELRNIEKQVYDLETSYLHDSTQCGNVLKGYEGFLSSSKSTTNLKRSRKFQPEERLFSLSSVTSPAAEEHMVGRDDGRGEYGPGRLKGGSIPINGQGKQKKGRTAPREGKRIRPSSEPDIDDDDDPDLSLR
ncbi:hypothetical protein H6P81_004592 [Aristolochia fimbriata]|uniref:Chromatin modification-related protein MEAF6 n=1 Tax=Aristolochia fimbriata TaxID=158543 RepID=A0AAV7ES61_ARIFI|nr:hypothetical protein H6P81_004592 [Aristolochia fimbriata]